jgi:hypothetical protein
LLSQGEAYFESIPYRLNVDIDPSRNIDSVLSKGLLKLASVVCEEIRHLDGEVISRYSLAGVKEVSRASTRLGGLLDTLTIHLEW